MESIKLQDIFNIKGIFHPAIFYEGATPITRGRINKQDFYLFNSKKEGNRDLYQEFLDKYYYKPMGEIFNSEPLARNTTPQIIITDGYNEPGRGLHFSYGYLLNLFLAVYNPELMIKMRTESMIPDDLIKFEPEIKAALRNERLMLSDIKNKGTQSEHYPKIKRELEEFEKLGISPNLTTYIEGRIDSLRAAGLGIGRYNHFFSKPINVDELLACFDYDKFCLCTAWALLEINEVTEESIGALDHTIVHLEEYVKAIEKLREQNPHYKCKIAISNDANITVDYVIKKIKEMLLRHPNITTFDYKDILRVAKTLSDGEEIDLSLKKNEGLIEEAKEFLYDNKDVKAVWELLPSEDKGEKVSFSRTSLYTSSIKDPQAKALAEEARMRRYERMLKTKSYLEEDEEIKSHQLISLKGINEFDGYIAYVFGNGRVILEQYFEDVAKQKVAKEKATYVMSLFEFVELSKMKKLELIALIKKLKVQGHEEITLRRIPHDEELVRWKRDILQSVTIGGYSKKVIVYVRLLLDQGLLVNKETEKNL